MRRFGGHEGLAVDPAIGSAGWPEGFIEQIFRSVSSAMDQGDGCGGLTSPDGLWVGGGTQTERSSYVER